MTEARSEVEGAAGAIGADSKDYWDQVLEQLGRRRMFKGALAVLALLYAAAIYAPFLAGDRPFVLRAVDHGAYGQALRTLYPVTLAVGRLVAMTPDEYLAQRTEGSTQAFEETLSTEVGAARERVGTLSSYLAEGDAEPLRGYLDAVTAAVALARQGRREEAVEGMAVAKGLARDLRRALAPVDPEKPADGGVELVGRTSYPLLQAISPSEVFFMVLWGFVLLWPLWNRGVNRILLGGDRGRIRRRRRTKWACVLLVSLASAVLWGLTVGGSMTFAVSGTKASLTSGEIQATRAVFPPIPFGFAETRSGEYFRPPTWTAEAEIDDVGYYAHGARVPEPDVVTGVLPTPAPVEVRWGEPGRNASARHLIGTDSAGRDLLVRSLWGGRVSLSVGLVSAAILVLIGTVVGAIAGYFGGKIDLVLSRIIEIILCFPAFFLILMVVAFTDPDTVPPIIAIVVVIGFVRWTGVARLARGEFLKLREQEFVLASRALGLSPLRTIFRHILPNAMGPILVTGAFSVAAGILTESALSFLGFGVNDPIPSWGSLVNDSRSPEHWWVILFPGLLIFVTVSCYNLVGEAFRDAVDPRLKD